MSKFSVQLDLHNIGIPTLFKYNRFTIDASIHKQWVKYDEYLIKYKMCIAPEVLDKASASVREILNEMSEYNKYTFSVEKNKSKRYEHTTPYIRCVFDKSLLEYIKRIFVSTIVYAAKDMPLPENQHETIDFFFDTDNKTVTITDIHVYEPDDPYFEYARNAVSTLSVEAIGIGDFSNSDEKVKDFYCWDNISSWKKRSEIMKTGGEKSLEHRSGVYMLYDANSNEFYVGKAKNLRTRIIQHAENANGNDPIPNFTHYRYSIINMEYYEFLYLIENAAIHDCAMILDMPNASKLNKPLVRIAGKSSNSLDDCKIVNTHERQRKVEKKN